jgi:hypothetical protein
MCACNMGKNVFFYVPEWTTQTDKWTTIFYCLQVNLSGKLKFFIKFMGLKKKAVCVKKCLIVVEWWSIESSTCLKRFLILFLASAEWKNRILSFPSDANTHFTYLLTYFLTRVCSLHIIPSFVNFIAAFGEVWVFEGISVSLLGF